MANSLSNQEKPLRLITLPVSHYCEKARWALDRLNIVYTEEAHMPPFHRRANKKSGGGRTTPVLVTETSTLDDSTDILQYLNGMVTQGAKLYPDDLKLRQEVEKLEDFFDRELGLATRCWAYFHLLDDSRLMQKMWCASIPGIERLLFPLLFPLLRPRLRKLLNITPETAASSYEKIQSVFETVRELLGDGRSYLVGDRFSAADLTFACLAAPAVKPPEYGGSFPQLDEFPSKIAFQIKEFRETVAGQFALRMFREERRLVLK